MATYIMFGKYSIEAIKGISRDRSDKAIEVVRKFGGEVKGVYALLGKTDMVVIADFPSNAEAAKTSVSLTKLTGIKFATSPAIEIEEFDNMIGEL